MVQMLNRRVRRAMPVFAAAAALAVAGCTVTPKPLTDEERGTQAAQDRTSIFSGQEPLKGPLTLEQAFARALKYNLDQRVKLMQEAVARDDLDLTKYDLLPKLVADAGYLNRSNQDASSSQSVLTGQQSLQPSISSNRDHRVADLSLSWNILDFGVSYYDAREQADRTLIAGEERRKVIQSLMQDVRGAYWRAASAQKLANQVNDSIGAAQAALSASRNVENERLRAPIDALRYQKALLELLRQLQTVETVLEVSKTELASLINLPPGQDFAIAVPDESTMKIEHLAAPIDQMEQAALLHNPDLREESYQTRISVDETHKAILKMLPGITFSYGRNFDSNSFLVNNAWYQGAAQLSWNLLNIVSGPAQIHRANENVNLANIRREAVSMAVLAKVHIAYQQYLSTAKEYQWAQQSADVDQRLYQQMTNRTTSDAQGELERISAQVASVTSSLLQYQSYAEAQAALGRLYAALGVDPTPNEVASLDIDGLSRAVAQVMDDWQSGKILNPPQKQSSSPVAPKLPPSPPIALAPLQPVSPGIYPIAAQQNVLSKNSHGTLEDWVQNLLAR